MLILCSKEALVQAAWNDQILVAPLLYHELRAVPSVQSLAESRSIECLLPLY